MQHTTYLHSPQKYTCKTTQVIDGQRKWSVVASGIWQLPGYHYTDMQNIETHWGFISLSLQPYAWDIALTFVTAVWQWHVSAVWQSHMYVTIVWQSHMSLQHDSQMCQCSVTVTYVCHYSVTVTHVTAARQSHMSLQCDSHKQYQAYKLKLAMVFAVIIMSTQLPTIPTIHLTHLPV